MSSHELDPEFVARVQDVSGQQRDATIDELRAVFGDGPDLVERARREFGGELPPAVARTLADAGYTIGDSSPGS